MFPDKLARARPVMSAAPLPASLSAFGRSWCRASKAPVEPVTDLYAVACSKICVAVGVSGNVMASKDGGLTWVRGASCTANDLNGIACPSSSTCVAAKHVIISVACFCCGPASGGNVRETNDYLLRSGGTIVATTNGGTSWSSRQSGTSAILYGIACPSSATCAAVGDEGTILASTDGGSTWRGVPSGAFSPLNAIACPTSRSCVVVGAYGSIVTGVRG